MGPGNELLITEQVSEALHMHPNTIRLKCKSGEIRAFHIGRRWYVPRQALEEYIGEHGGAAALTGGDHGLPSRGDA